MPKNTFFNLPDEKRNRIIEGVKIAFSKAHYREVTIDSIVSYAKIPKGSFYQYFNNKDDVFRYVFKDLGIEKYSLLIDEIKKTSELKFSELINRLIIKANQFENQDEVMIGLKKRFLVECPQDIKEEILLDVMPQTIILFENIINIYIEKGEFRDNFNIRTAAFMLTSMLLNIDRYGLENEKDYEEVLKNACEILEGGLKKK